MYTQVLLAGLGLGIISSFHCVGMCGPLALALPVGHLGKNKSIIAIFLYNAGRVLTYSALGLLFGLAGRRIALAGWQQGFSIVLGSILLLVVLWQHFYKRSAQPAWMQRSFDYLQRPVYKLLQQKSLLGFAGIGIVNGLLPCGMVYLAIAGALATTSTGMSVLFMMGYGIGTMPAMMLLSFFKVRISISARQYIRKSIPYIAAGMAILLILRGMNLGIPFVSPVIASAAPDAIICH